MHGTPYVVAVARSQFLTWLHAGVMSSTELLRDRSGDGASEPLFFCRLPAKYKAVADRDCACLVLLDELEGVSLATPELTHEWRVRLANLSETWLPIAFRGEWMELVRPASAADAGRAVNTIAEPAGNASAPAETTLPATVEPVADTGAGFAPIEPPPVESTPGQEFVTPAEAVAADAVPADTTPADTETAPTPTGKKGRQRSKSKSDPAGTAASTKKRGQTDAGQQPLLEGADDGSSE